MRCNRLSHLASVSRQRVQAACQKSVLSLKTVVFRPQIDELLRAFPSLSRVFLDMIAVVWQPVLVGRAWGWKQSP
jgi:recombinational DNA repair ATPase RecF